MTVEKLPPQNIEAEQSVLGGVLIDPDAIIRVASFLRPEDFYRESHGRIYEAILHLYERREPADFVTVCDELERLGQLEGVGGASYLTSLINAVPTSAHVEHYGHIVERTALLRRLISAECNVRVRSMKSGYLKEGDWSKITDAAQVLEKLPVYMSDSAGWTTASLHADLARSKANYGITWFVFDYLMMLNDMPMLQMTPPRMPMACRRALPFVK